MAKPESFSVPVAYTRYKVKPKAKLGPLGLTDFNKQTISVSNELTEVGQWSATFWHEWMHAVTHEGGYEQVNDNEAFIEYMAQSIMRMLTDPSGRELVLKMIKKLKPHK